MKKKMKLLISSICVVAIVSLVSGCGGTKPTENQNKQTQATGELSVSFRANPDKSNTGDPVTFQANVKQGENGVTNAKVEFEVWKGTSTDHKQYPAKHISNGDYTASDSFKDAGTYHVIVHVYTDKDHKMAEGTFQVGEQKAEEHGHQHGEQKASLHIMLPDSIEKGKSFSLMGHVMDAKGKPLTGANVKFEIWKEGDKKHQFIDVSEGKAGEYTKDYSFAESGKYHVQLHVEKPSIKLHEHVEKTVSVK
ncbi:FixH family protein [Thermoactinomyces sp. DSM 45892]|uniref:FixH family protein n=1 Tax=Thermoactinomyces sp. DSM 45892 TaxID=1882753 RepID=UPI0008958CF4|nr:FixH family protein [Thermoactinomyces sp. DSM 45892]SDY94202.1 YtkA-like [Thermoactinomyces sp. DSM 45892]